MPFDFEIFSSDNNEMQLDTDFVQWLIEERSAAGALTCSKFGSIESLPTKAEIIELLQKHS